MHLAWQKKARKPYDKRRGAIAENPPRYCNDEIGFMLEL